VRCEFQCSFIAISIKIKRTKREMKSSIKTDMSTKREYDYDGKMGWAGNKSVNFQPGLDTRDEGQAKPTHEIMTWEWKT